MYQDLHFYVDFDENLCVDNFDDFFNKLEKLVRLAYQHKSSVHYSQQQIQHFNDYLTLDENFSQSLGNKLDVMLENAIVLSKSSHFFEVCFAGQHTSLNYVDNQAISVIKPHTQNALISFSFDHCKPLLLVKSSEHFESIKFKILRDAISLLEWIQSNSSRIFNLSKKHGENGQGNWTNQSVLLCSKSQAQELLNKAIPDFIEKEKRLFNFDAHHQTFIEFFYEGENPQNQWHGFHVDEAEWQNRIPVSIRKYFNKY